MKGDYRKTQIASQGEKGVESSLTRFMLILYCATFANKTTSRRRKETNRLSPFINHLSVHPDEHPPDLRFQGRDIHPNRLPHQKSEGASRLKRSFWTSRARPSIPRRITSVSNSAKLRDMRSHSFEQGNKTQLSYEKIIVKHPVGQTKSDHGIQRQQPCLNPYCLWLQRDIEGPLHSDSEIRHIADYPSE